MDEYLAAYQARTGQPEYMVSEIFIPVSNPGQDAEVQRLAPTLFDLAELEAPASGNGKNGHGYTVEDELAALAAV